MFFYNLIMVINVQGAYVLGKLCATHQYLVTKLTYLFITSFCFRLCSYPFYDRVTTSRARYRSAVPLFDMLFSSIYEASIQLIVFIRFYGKQALFKL